MEKLLKKRRWSSVTTQSPMLQSRKSRSGPDRGPRAARSARLQARGTSNAKPERRATATSRLKRLASQSRGWDSPTSTWNASRRASQRQASLAPTRSPGNAAKETASNPRAAMNAARARRQVVPPPRSPHQSHAQASAQPAPRPSHQSWKAPSTTGLKADHWGQRAKAANGSSAAKATAWARPSQRAPCRAAQPGPRRTTSSPQPAWTSATCSRLPGQTRRASAIAAPSPTAAPGRGSRTKRMPAPSSSTAHSATAAWWSRKPIWEYQKCPDSSVSIPAASQATDVPKLRRATQNSAATAAAPSSGGTHMAARSSRVGSAGEASGCSRAATLQSKSGVQIGLAPWGNCR